MHDCIHPPRMNGRNLKVGFSWKRICKKDNPTAFKLSAIYRGELNIPKATIELKVSQPSHVHCVWQWESNPKSPATCTVEDIEAEHQVSWECLETLFDNMLRFNAFQWNGISFPTRLGWGNPSLWTLIARSCTCLVDSIPNVRKPKERCAWRKVAIDWSCVLVLMMDDVDRMCCFLLLFFLSFFLPVVSAGVTRSSAMFMCR